MSESVAQAIAGRTESLYEKLASNEALSNLIMGFLGHMVVSCARRGKSVAAIRTGAVTETLGDFKFKVEYLPVVLSRNVLWSPQEDMKRYVAAKSASLARCFEVNPSLVKTFTNLVESIDQYCKHKQILFKDFKIKKSYITQGDIFVLRSGTASLDNFKGRGRY